MVPFSAVEPVWRLYVYAALVRSEDERRTGVSALNVSTHRPSVLLTTGILFVTRIGPFFGRTGSLPRFQ